MFVAVEERKLFIGMLSKKLNENDVRMMFAPFGTIEDCTVLRDANSSSRGKFYFYLLQQAVQKDMLTKLKQIRSPSPPIDKKNIQKLPSKKQESKDFMGHCKNACHLNGFELGNSIS